MKKFKYELTDNLIGIDGLGAYHGYFNPSNMFDSYQMEQDKEDGYIDYTPNQYWEKFDNDSFTDALVKLVGNKCSDLCYELNYFLNKYHTDYNGNIIVNPIESIDCVGMDSPKYYNYRDDWFKLDFDVNYQTFKKSLWNVANEHTEFLKWLKDNYTSCSGFISYTANNYSEWEKGFKEDREQEIGAILSFIINTLLDYDFVDDCIQSSEIHYSEFFKDKV